MTYWEQMSPARLSPVETVVHRPDWLRLRQIGWRQRAVGALGLSAVLALVPASDLSRHEDHHVGPDYCGQSSEPSRQRAAVAEVGILAASEHEYRDPATACLATLGPDCVDFGSPHGLPLCLNYGLSSVVYQPESMTAFIRVSVGPHAEEFYTHTLVTPAQQCGEHLDALGEVAKRRLWVLPAFVGSLIDVNGLMSDCLSDPERDRINAESSG